jgi:hypothetical protein
MINQKLFGVLLIAGATVSSLLIANDWSQTANAQMLPDSADIDVEEAMVAENATATNKTTSANMTGTISTR